MVAGAATIGTAMLPASPVAFAGEENDHAPITKGDIAILTFLSALEQVEADLWIQYAELGGATNQGLSPIDLPFTGGLAPAYITGLLVLDGDMPQYISDNTDDEISHNRRHLMVDAVSQRDRKPRLRREIPERRPGLSQGTTSGHSPA